MHLVDEIFRDFIEFAYIEELRGISSLDIKYKKIDEIVSRANVFKAEAHNLTTDEQLYLDYKIQEKGVDLNLCSNFYIFFSNRNSKFHHVCKKDDKRVFCRGKTNKCQNK